MNWLKEGLNLLVNLFGKLKLFIAYYLGFKIGKKIQKLEDDNAYLKLKEKAARHKNEKEKSILEKWNRLRANALRVVPNSAHQPSKLPESSESVIVIADDGSELRAERE